MRKFFIFICAAVMTALTTASCKTSDNTTSKNVSSQDVPFIIADHYFVKNDVKTLPNGIIKTQEDFYRVFGEATVMGGLPTNINFNKQFVIAVSVPETDYHTTISPLSLKQDWQNLVFTYHVDKGEKMGYRIQPVLIIVVDKKYEAQLKVQEQ